MLWPLLLCGLVSLAVILRLLHQYGDRKRCAWYVQVAAVTSWYLPFTIVFILPFDFSSTLYRGCSANCDEPMGYIGDRLTRQIWWALYWTMYLLTWLVIPLIMSYVDSGAFSFRDRLRESAWTNLQFYGVSGLIGLVVVGYIAVTRQFFGADLMAFLMAAANFWGLMLVILFMGFGLVSIPRKLWHRGDLKRELRKIERRAMAYKDKAYDAELELADIVNEVNMVARRINQTDDLRPCVETILDKCPRLGDRAPQASVARVPDAITEAYLAQLHNRVKQAVLRDERDRWRWRSSTKRAFFLQDALASRINPNRQIESNLRPWNEWSPMYRSLMWWWYIIFRPLVFRALSIGAAIMSISVLWSELTFNVTAPHLSIVHHVLQSLGLTYFAIELTSILLIAYMSLCAYSSVMQLKIFNIYSLEAHHHTNERSLLFCGAYLCRLMFPLCYNFLTMAGGLDDTEFARFMGRIDLVPVLGEQSNRAIPVLIMIPATLAFFNVHGRVVEYFSISRIASPDVRTGNDDEEAELGPLALPDEEGRALILEARRATERREGNSRSVLRRYSPTGDIHANNFRGHISSASASADVPLESGVRDPREWHLGRPSLEQLTDDGSQSPFLPDMFTHIARNSGSNEDDTDDNGDVSDSEGSGRSQPPNATQKPTGLAARFGRWLPESGSMPPPPRRMANGGRGVRAPPSRLRNTTRFNYASDDALTALRSPSPDLMGAVPRHQQYGAVGAPRSHYRQGSDSMPSLHPLVLARGDGARDRGASYTSLSSAVSNHNAAALSPIRQTSSTRSHMQRPVSRSRNILHSPSSPSNPLNPWIDPSDSASSRQLRRHALSDAPPPSSQRSQRRRT